MKRLNTSSITPTVGFPTKKGTIDFLQDSHKEEVNDLLRMFIGENYSLLNVYVLFGCKQTVVGSNINISEGSVFTNGEIFHSPPQTVSVPTGLNVVVLNLGTTQYSSDADPVIFTDLASRNVHDIRQVSYNSSGLTSTGNLNGTVGIENDYNSLIFLYSDILSIGALGSAPPLTFERNKTLICTASGSTNFSISDDNAVIGNEIHLFISGTAPIPVLTDGAGTGWNIVIYSYSTGGFSNVAARLRYLGKISGLNYVTFEVIGFILPL